MVSDINRFFSIAVVVVAVDIDAALVSADETLETTSGFLHTTPTHTPYANTHTRNPSLSLFLSNLPVLVLVSVFESELALKSFHITHSKLIFPPNRRV